MPSETALLETYKKNRGLFNALSDYIDDGTITPGSDRQAVAYICYKLDAVGGSREEIIVGQQLLLKGVAAALPITMYEYILSLLNTGEAFSTNHHGDHVSLLYYQYVQYHGFVDYEDTPEIGSSSNDLTPIGSDSESEFSGSSSSDNESLSAPSSSAIGEISLFSFEI